MPKVLVITYYWPPSGGSGVQRWVKFSKYLQSNGWEVVAYTPKNPEMPSVDHSLEADIPFGTTVVKQPITEIYSIYRKLTGKSSSTKEVNPINHQKKSIIQRAIMWVRGNFFVPDPRVSWVRPSVNFLCKYLKVNPVNAIVSTGPPHSMHLIGMEVAKRTGLPWIADFRDPWTRIFYFKHLAIGAATMRKHQRLEQLVLDSATRVVAVSPLVQEEFRSMTMTPVALITNGYDPDDYTVEVQTTGFFDIVHTGLFASDGNPDVLWDVLAEKCSSNPIFKDRLRIRLTGKNDLPIIQSIRDAGLGDNLVDLGYQDHTVAIREQMAASVLILPLRKEPEYKATLPGKLFEYLGARRPILGIGQTDGAMARVVADTGAGEVYEWDDRTGLASAIDRLYGRWSTGENMTPSGNILAYSRTSTARQMAELLDEVSGRCTGSTE